MTTQAINLNGPAAPARAATGNAAGLDAVSAAFALSAAVTIVFNTLLTWAKEAYPALNSFMASLTGHHWITHGMADVLLFFALGLVFMNLGTAARMAPQRLMPVLAAAVVAAGLGLAGWFVLG
jgi:hypothetical protein